LGGNSDSPKQKMIAYLQQNYERTDANELERELLNPFFREYGERATWTEFVTHTGAKWFHEDEYFRFLDVWYAKDTSTAAKGEPHPLSTANLMFIDVLTLMAKHYPNEEQTIKQIIEIIAKEEPKHKIFLKVKNVKEQALKEWIEYIHDQIFSQYEGLEQYASILRNSPFVQKN
jgi:hypothetical protein